MVQHETLMDVFTKGMRAASPFLQDAADRLRERNELELKNNAARFATDLQDFIRDKPFNYTGDPDDGEGLKSYTEEYRQKLTDFADGEFARYRKSNTSSYYRRELERMQTRSAEALRDHALVEGDKWRVGREQVSLLSDLDNYAGSGWDTAKIVDASKTRITLYKTKVELNPEQEQALWQRQYMTVAGSVLGKVNYTGGLKSALDELNQTFASLINQTQGNNGQEPQTGAAAGTWGFQGKSKWDEALIEQETNRIHRQNMDSILTADAQYRRLQEEAIRTGNTTLGAEAEQIAQPYRDGVIAALLEGGKDSITEYADSDKDRILGLFMPYDSKGVNLKGASRSQMKALVDLYGEELMRAYFNGETEFENGKALLAVLPEMLYEQVEAELGGEYPGGPGQFYRDHADYFSNMENALMKVAKSDGLRAMIPERMKVFKRMIESNVKLQKTLAKDYAGQLELINKYFEEEYFDFLTSLKWDNPSEALEKEIQAGTQEIIGRYTSASIALIGKASSKSPFAGQETKTREKELAERLDAMDQSPGIISSRRDLKNPVYLRGPDSDPAMYERGLRAIGTEAGEWIARSQLPANASEQEVLEWTAKLRQEDQIDVRRDELNPAAVFQYDNRGIFYRVKPEKNDKGKLTGRIIIERQATEGKSAKELQEDRWQPQKVNRERVEKGDFKAKKEARDELPGNQRRQAINIITDEFDKTAKENLIRHFLETGWISPEDAEKLLKGELL